MVPASLTVLRRAFVDIVRGYSIIVYQGSPVYIRHLTHRQHVDLDDLQSRYEIEARAKGAKTESERLAELKASGQWTDRHELDLSRQRDTLIRFEEAKRTHSVPSIIEQYDRQIADEKKRLTDMIVKRVEAIGMTSELYAQRVLNDHYVVTNLFTNPELTKPLFDAGDFDMFTDAAVEEIMTTYSTATEPCNDENLRRLTVQDFFTSYYNLCNDNLQSFYGRPICDLTYYQVRLGNMARYFKSLLEHTDLSKLDPSVRGDPDAIERLYTAQKNMEAQKAEGKLPSNMTNSDIKAMGLQGQYASVTKELSGADLIKHQLANRR